MLITFREIIDLVVMTIALGYLFKDAFPKQELASHESIGSLPASTMWKDLQFAAIITAPAIILHELAHKFVALSFGAQAVFHAHYWFLGLGVLLKLLNFGFIFFIPGYVTHTSVAPLASSMIAVAGPLLNLILWLGSAWLLKNNLVKKRFKAAVYLTQRINMFLFLLNMIPIPPFDGFGFVSGLWAAFF